MIRRDDADRNDMVRRGDHSVGGHGHDRVVVAGGKRVGEIADVVGQ